MKWEKLSKKQLQLFTWWMKESPYSSYDGVIAEGAIRSGKTLIGSFGFLVWSMNCYDRQVFAICGKTVGSLRRNVITSLKEVLINRGYKVIDRQAENKLVVAKDGVTNTYYLFGGRDERSQDLIQGITLAGIFMDEVALMPRSFVEQAMGRCSVKGAKFWFNCNPEGPQHWFYTEIVKKSEEKKLLRLHFRLEDNLSLSQEILDRYNTMFSGIFYRRFILGEWAFADGVVYDCFDINRNTYRDFEREQVLPLVVLDNDPWDGYPFYGVDYGVFNPQVFLEIYKYNKPGDKIPYFYVDKEYYYDSRKKMKQKTDDEYIKDYLDFVDNKHNKGMIIDPSASSLIVAAHRNGIRTQKANNDVANGIRMVYTLLNLGHIRINYDKCPNLINELGLYVWNEKRGESGKEEVVKQYDHALDALRYAVYTTTPDSLIFGKGVK